jgi:hypothetical protein
MYDERDGWLNRYVFRQGRVDMCFYKGNTMYDERDRVVEKNERNQGGR